MSPSLPLAIALAGKNFVADPRVSHADFAIYLTNYVPVDRLPPEQVLGPDMLPGELEGKTVFIDASPTLVMAAAVLPSGQFVTTSEIVAQLLADVEQGQTVISPTWLRAMQWLAPMLLAIIAVLFLPARNRRDIVLVATITLLLIVTIEGLVLLVGRMRLDLGRSAIIFLGASILAWWLAGTVRKAQTRQRFSGGRKTRTCVRGVSPLRTYRATCLCNVQAVTRIRRASQARASRGRHPVDEANTGKYPDDKQVLVGRQKRNATTTRQVRH